MVFAVAVGDTLYQTSRWPVGYGSRDAEKPLGLAAGRLYRSDTTLSRYWIDSWPSWADVASEASHP